MIGSIVKYFHYVFNNHHIFDLYQLMSIYFNNDITLILLGAVDLWIYSAVLLEKQVNHET
jgi:hypothetical protein